MEKKSAFAPKWLIPLLVIGLLGLLAWSISQKEKAPDVQLSTLEGKTLKLSDLHGKVVLVNFWATTCPGCVAEMPDIKKAYQDFHPQGFEVVAIAMPYDDLAQIKTFTQQNNLPFMVAKDTDGTLGEAFKQVRVTPTSFVLDAQGHIVHKVVGEITYDTLKQIIAQHPPTGA